MAAAFPCLEGDVVRMELIMDERTLNWFPPDPNGVVDISLLNPSYFDADNEGWQYIPFKYHTEGAALACKFFRNAQKAGKVGPARAGLFLTMQKNAFLEALFSGTVGVFADRQSVGFFKALNATNYPSLATGELTIESRTLTL